MSKNKTKVVAEAGGQELFVIREFEAPRELVLRAHLDPRLFTRWYGCEGMVTKLDKFEPKPGGQFRYVQKLKDFPEFILHGVFHDVSESKIVRTQEFAGYAGHVLMETLTFEDLPGGRCRITGQSVFQSVADRDAMVQLGVEKGAGEAHGQLDRLLEELRSS